MSIETCAITIDGRPFDFEVEGDFAWGDDEVLYDANGVISQASWEPDGYAVLDVFTPEEHARILQRTRSIIVGLFDEFGFEHADDVRLEDYHRVVNTRERHQQMIQRTRMLTNKDFPVDIAAVAERLSALLGRRVGPNNPDLEALGLPKEIVQLRISRPDSMDINPLHRDGYLAAYKHILNTWIPIVGCDARTSLPVVPGSHRWNEQNVCRTAPGTAKIGGLTYRVPCILEAKQPLATVRPDPKPGQMLVFTPFLVHGVAINQSDVTRMSFELRLYDEEA